VLAVELTLYSLTATVTRFQGLPPSYDDDEISIGKSLQLLVIEGMAIETIGMSGTDSV
jgi:hypothetical protein